MRKYLEMFEGENTAAKSHVPSESGPRSGGSVAVTNYKRGISSQHPAFTAKEARKRTD